MIDAVDIKVQSNDNDYFALLFRPT